MPSTREDEMGDKDLPGLTPIGTSLWKCLACDASLLDLMLDVDLTPKRNVSMIPLEDGLDGARGFGWWRNKMEEHL